MFGIQCCDQFWGFRPDPDDTGAVCMTVEEGEARLDAATKADTATSEASGVLVAIVSCLSLLILVALVLVAKRRKDEKEKETPEDGAPDIGRSAGLNPMFNGEGPGKASMIGGATTMVGADGKTMRADGSALHNGGGTAIEHSSGIAYDMCHNNGNGSEYMTTDGDTLAAGGRAGANVGTEAVYDAGAARADPTYDVGGARVDPTYDVGGARVEAVYDNGASNAEDDPNIYNMAQSADAPDYDLGGAVSVGAARRGDADGVYNNRQQVEALYGTSLSGSISTNLTVLNWICVGTHRCGALPSPVCA